MKQLLEETLSVYLLRKITVLRRKKQKSQYLSTNFLIIQKTIV